MAFVQGSFYLATGIWPIVHIQSFLAVTGPKEDLWLVQTVGALVIAIGAALIVAAWLDEVNVPVRILGGVAALMFVLVDVVFHLGGAIGSIYLVDAAAEVLLLVGWIVTSWGRPHTTRARPA